MVGRLSWRGLLLTLMAAGIDALIAAGSGATRADAAVSQPVSGLGIGNVFVIATGSPRDDTGSYASFGQLGSGSYHFSSPGPFLSCGAHNEGSQLNGTAQFTRSDGAQLSGNINVCEIDGSPFQIHLTAGTRDLI